MTHKEANILYYRELRRKHPSAIILMLCGSQCECYEDNAADVAKILDLPTSVIDEDCMAKGWQCCSFPHHRLDDYLPRITRAGRRVAICDQPEDPQEVEKLPKRSVTDMTNTRTHEHID